ILLGLTLTGENTGDSDRNITNRESFAHVDVAARSERLPDDRCVLMSLKRSPVPVHKNEVAIRTNFVGRGAVEHNHIETGPTVVGEDLDGHDVADARQLADDAIVVLRQMAGRRTELVGLKDDED